MSKIIEVQKDWIKSGKIGCVFASALVKQSEKIGWHFIVNPEKLEIPKDSFILSIVFTDKTVHDVRKWALENGFFIEDYQMMLEGLRIKQGAFVSWVQYFGPDSHVKTRQSPYPMLSFACKLPAKYYWRVGFNGILHLAHASIKNISDKAADTLWNQSVKKTKKELGESPSFEKGSAAKITFKL